MQCTIFQVERLSLDIRGLLVYFCAGSFCYSSIYTFSGLLADRLLWGGLCPSKSKQVMRGQKVDAQGSKISALNCFIKSSGVKESFRAALGIHSNMPVVLRQTEFSWITISHRIKVIVH